MKSGKLKVRCILGLVFITMQTPAWGNIILSPDLGAAALFYLIDCASIVLFVIGCILLLMSLFAIKLKRVAGKIVFVTGIIFLVPFGFFITQRMQDSRSSWNELGPLLQAIDKNKYSKVNQLIQNGYDVNEDRLYTYPSTPLTYALTKGNIRIIQLLVENGANVNAKPNNGSKPLMEAIFLKDTTILNYLLEHGADMIPEKETGTPIYPLSYAIGLSDWRDTATLTASKAVVEALLKHGADPNACSDNGFTPLQEAIERKNYEVVRCLLEYGADKSSNSDTLP
jgi:hypothetical protein